MNIIQLCPKLNQGGVERGVIEMANYLSDKNITNHICSNGGVLTPQLTNTNHLTLPIHKKNPFSMMFNAVKLANYIKKNNIDIIHAHSRAPAWVGLMASKLCDAKYTSTYHAAYGHHNCFKKAYSYPMRAGEKIGVVSDFIQKHLCDVYNVPAEKIIPAYRCFDEEIFAEDKIDKNEVQALKEKYNLEGKNNILCLVGRISKLKGQTHLLKALSLIENKDWTLLIVGSEGNSSNNVTNDIKRLIKKFGFEDKVILTGNQTKPELFYALSDICFSLRVAPEAFGRIPVEAQALKKIIIASNLGGHLETVLDNKTGYLVKYDDINDWADKISTAMSLSKAERLKMGEEGYKWVHSKYTLTKMCESEIELYKEILK